MDIISVERIAEAVERELARVKAARPVLASRVDRAASHLTVHLSCQRSSQRVIRVRVGADGARFLVNGSSGAGAVYVVDPNGWGCSCPDAHRQGKGCKHSILCWALWRASARPALPGNPEDLLEHVGEVWPVGWAVLPGVPGHARLRECGGRFQGCDLHPVRLRQDHLLTFFEGDELCVPGDAGCAGGHGFL